MALLFITHKFPPGIGGMEKQSYELLNGMSKKAKCYSIVQSPAEPKLWFFICLWYRIAKMIRKHPDISVIHANDAVVASFCAVFIRNKHIKKTATFHGLDILFPNVFFQRIIVPYLRNLDQVFTVSQATAQACLERNFKPEQLVVIKNGVDHALSKVERDPHFLQKIYSDYGIDLVKHRLLLSTGRAVRRKGFSWFIDKVMPLLSTDYRYVVIGPRFERESWLRGFWPNSLLRQWDLFWGKPSDSDALRKAMLKDRRSIAVGSVPYPELLQWMAHADLFIMPNRPVEGDMEGFGLVALEAGLCGTYVVASKLEGITCAVKSGENGELIENMDTEHWVSTLNSLTKGDARAELFRKGRNARNYVLGQYKWSTMVEQYYETFIHLESEKNVSGAASVWKWTTSH